MRYLIIVFTAAMALAPLCAQNAPLIADPATDQFEFCKHLYNQANATKDERNRTVSYRRLIPRLQNYIKRFPNHPNAAAVLYYLGESYYYLGSLDEAKRVLHRVVNRYREGRYVALASNRLGYDAVANKKYAQAAVHFERVATMSTTIQERYRGRYQQASCYRYANMVDEAISAYSKIESADDALVLYRQHAILKLGHLYLDKKNNDKALEKFEAIMLPFVVADVRIEATLNAGIIYLEQKKNDLAENAFKAVILSEENKFKPSAQAALMNVMYSQKNYEIPPRLP